MEHLKRINEFYDYHDENRLKEAKDIEELMTIAEEMELNKGELMTIAFGNNYRNVDSGLPMSVWDKLEAHGGSQWFVMDYNEAGAFGKLVHLGEKILGIESNWWEKLED
jgi:hypothetical protein